MFRPKTKLSDSVFEATPLSILLKVLYETKIRKRKKKKEEKKNKVLKFLKIEYYKKVLDFRNIEYHITFLITQIPCPLCHAGDSPRNSSSLNLSTILNLLL